MSEVFNRELIKTCLARELNMITDYIGWCLIERNTMYTLDTSMCVPIEHTVPRETP